MTAKKFVPRPDHVFIINHTYQIIWLNEDEWLDDRHDPDSDAETYARVNHIYMRIRQGVHETHYQEVLWHEIGHCIWDCTMLTHVDLHELKDAEEFVVGLQSPPMVFVLRQNPDLLKWLVSDRD